MAENKSKCCYEKLFLRLVVVVVFLYHGIPKALDWEMAAGKFVGMGFPGFLGGIVGVVEVVAAVMILVGYQYKWANYALAAIIVVAIVGVQIPGAQAAGKWLTSGLERDLLILAATLFLAKGKPGMYTLKSK